jgi:signal transduction histidine kinase
MKLEVEDNGMGFTVPSSLDDFSNSGKFDLLGMRGRVEPLGGKLIVNSVPSKGTQITVLFGLP